MDDASHDYTLNKACELEDWENSMLARWPQHRKCWEYVQLMRGIGPMLTPEAWVLSVGAGYESVVFELTNTVRYVHAVDLYGTSNFSGDEAQTSMLTNPDSFAPVPYRRGRLVVQYMNGCDLRYEEDTFDIVFSLSSIEHFGGVQAGRKALSEIRRVLKPGGIVMLATELIVNGAPHFSAPNLELFTPDTLRELLNVDGLLPVEPLRFSTSRRTLEACQQLTKVIEDGAQGQITYPHLTLEHEGRIFTSVSVFLRKTAQN